MAKSIELVFFCYAGRHRVQLLWLRLDSPMERERESLLVLTAYVN